jgi:hypothetical protein
LCSKQRIDRELQGRAGPDRPDVMGRAAEDRKNALGAIEHIAAAANEMDQLPAVGLRTRTDDRCFEEGGAGDADMCREFAHPAGRKRAGFNGDGARAKTFQCAVVSVAPDRARSLVIADHGDDDLGVLRRDAWRLAMNGACGHQSVDGRR